MPLRQGVHQGSRRARAGSLRSTSSPQAHHLGSSTLPFLVASRAYRGSLLLVWVDQLEGPFAMLLAAILIRSAIRVMWRRQANGAAFGLGIAAAVFNPMSIAFFLSFFVAHQAFLSSAWIAPAVVFVMAALWSSLVGICLGRLSKVEIDPMLASYPKLAVEISMIAYAFYVVRTAL